MMKASSWKKAADIIARATLAEPQEQAAAMAESQNLQSLPLSTLSVDDSGPPQVTYEPQQPIATSTPRATSTESPEISTEAYRQKLPGMSARLYLTLIADSSLDTHIPDNQDMLQMQLTSEVDKYLQEVAERHEMDVNYFDGQHVATNTISHQQKADSAELEADEILEFCKVPFAGFCRVWTFYQSSCCLHKFFLVFSFRCVRFCLGNGCERCARRDLC